MREYLLTLALLLNPLYSYASNPEIFGDWIASVNDEGEPYTGTYNESGGMLGKWCDSGSCFWMYATPDTICEAGGKYPALINSDLGAYAVTLTCSTTIELANKTYYRQIISGPETLDSIANKSQSFGLVLPMQGDSFKAIRFGMGGSSRALKRFNELAEAKARNRSGKKSKSGVSTRDINL